MHVFVGVLLVLLVLAFAGLQLVAGFQGIQLHLGTGWAIGAAILAFFRLPLFMTIGAFFGAKDVWGWHWALALLFAFPGLAFMMPALFAALFGRLSRR